MKFLLSVISTAALSLLLQLLLPWWSIVIAASIIGMFFSQVWFKTFLSGFLGIAIVWWVYAGIIDISNQSILSEKIAEIFHLGGPVLLILVSGLIAGIAGGLAALSGSEAKKLV